MYNLYLNHLFMSDKDEVMLKYELLKRSNQLVEGFVGLYFEIVHSIFLFLLKTNTTRVATFTDSKYASAHR